MPALIERPKMTCTMYQALKKHILKEREKKKQELEQDAELERQKNERETRKRKKEENDSLTLEQTKEQITTLERRLEELKGEKHDVFSKLKKVLHEDETRRRSQQVKEQRTEGQLVLSSHPYSQAIPGSHSSNAVESTSPRSTRPSMFRPQQMMIQGIKRPRSPSPPPQGFVYTQFGQGDSKYGAGGTYRASAPQHGPYSQKPVTYPGQSAPGYQPPAGHYQASQAAGKYATPANQSAFSSYPSHYAQHQQAMNVPGFQVARMQQPGFIHATPHRPIQQSVPLESPGVAKPVKDKYKMQQQTPSNAVPVTHQPAPLPQHQSMLQHMQLAQSQQKGSILTGHPMRTQGVTSTYPTSTGVQSQASAVPRATAGFQAQGQGQRFFN